jgi:polyhydroxyalkanoate synthesis regulator phasin
MDTRRADPGNLQPKDFPNPVVNIQNAPALPDPSGLQSILQLIGKGDSFRDLTGLNQNQLNALATFQKSLDTAMAFGKEASELAKAAVSLKMVEDGKKSGTINNEDANKRSNEILDNLQKDPNASRLQQSIDLIDKLKKEGKISDADAEAVKNSLLKNFQDSSNAKNTMANDEIRKLAEKAKETNKDISIKRPDGETVEIKNPGDNSSSSPESGLQRLSLDAIAAGGTLKFLPVNGTEPVDPSKAQLKIILDNGGWVPTTMGDYSSLITGDNTLGFRAFTGLLRHLSILPKGSVQILNLICHCPDFQTLVFRRDFIFSELTGETKAVDPDPQSPAFNEVTSLELMQLSTMETLAVSGELQMKLEDVRTTFAADAEVRLFCIGDKATESLAQTLSNLFQVKVLSFTDARIEFRVEIIEGAEVFNQPALTKKIVATPQFSTVPFVFDNFEQMVTEDAAKTGRFISHPRRP